ncbi:MAG: tetratricopeptide repeat protein, partial [Rhodothermales bacterium]|nr:tetratricopeptide repeat protein [Rhodothermales bacterium]
FRGRLFSDRESWLKAAQDGRAALDHVFKVAEIDTSSADAVFGVGVYDYFGAAIPERYPVVRPLMIFFPDANRARGLRRLERVVDEGRFIHTEAAWFLLQIHLVFEPDYTEALRYARWLRGNYPENALFHLMEGRVFVKWGQWDESAGIFREVAALYDAGSPGYSEPLASQAHYFLGRNAMRLGDHRRALEHFARVGELEEKYDHDSYVLVQSELRKGMTHDLLGQREQALRAYRRVLRMDDRGASRERARRYISEPYLIE